jgi:hypothetical protein
MNARDCMINYSECRREGWDHWESVWITICDATR